MFLCSNVFATDLAKEQKDRFEFNRTSESGLQWFIGHYEGKDHAGLVDYAKELLEIKRDLTLSEIERAYLTISSSSDFDAFLTKYKNHDRKDLLNEVTAKQKEIKVKAIKNEFVNLNSLRDFQNFISKYSKNDIAGLVPDANKKVISILKKQQQSDYELATNKSSLNAFIQKYSVNDYADLLPSVKEKLVVIAKQKQTAIFKNISTMSDLKLFINDYQYSDPAALVGTAKRKLQDMQNEVSSFRKSISIGDDSNCGLIVEVKENIVQVETMIGLKYLKINQIYPETLASCKFVNNKYVSS
jgi:hypothetical protein